jgi:hypothetical protein
MKITLAKAAIMLAASVTTPAVLEYVPPVAISGANSVPMAQMIFNDHLDASQFGVGSMCDAAGDCSAQLQQALDTACQNGLPCEVLLGPGVWYLANPVVIRHPFVGLVGAGRNATFLLASTNFADRRTDPQGSIIRGISNFMVQMDGASDTNGPYVENLTIDCQNVPNCSIAFKGHVNEQSHFANIVGRNFTRYGFFLCGADSYYQPNFPCGHGAQGDGPDHDLYLLPSPNNAEALSVFLFNATGYKGLENVSLVPDQANTVNHAGVISGNQLAVRNVHMEGFSQGGLILGPPPGPYCEGACNGLIAATFDNINWTPQTSSAANPALAVYSATNTEFHNITGALTGTGCALSIINSRSCSAAIVTLAVSGSSGKVQIIAQ